MSQYYDELAHHTDAALKDGWRHELEQRLRFEVVLRALRIDGNCDVVDLGCGTGRLGAYLGERSGRYVGVDKIENSIILGQRSLPDGEFIWADLNDEIVDEAGPFDFAVAIGTMVDGECLGDVDRRNSLAGLIERLDELAKRGWALVVLSQDRLEKDPIRSLEPALCGARRVEVESELRRLGRSAHIDEVAIPTDLFVLHLRDEEPDCLAERIAGDVAHEAVIEGAGSETDPADLAWFWLATGRLERAKKAIENIPGTNRRREILARRLDLAMAGAVTRGGL